MLASTRTAAAAVAILLAFAPLAAAQDANRAYSGAIGSVSMPRDTAAGADVAATVTVNGAAAAAAGATWILVSVGNDAASGLTVSGATVQSTVAPARTEGDGTNRVNTWFDAASLPDGTTLTVTADADPGGVPTDVEVVLQAFNAAYAAVNGADGAPLSVQSWTGLAAGDGTTDDTTTNETTTGNDTVPTPDDTIGGGLDDDGAVGDDLGDNEEESTDRGIPTLGVIAGAGAVVAVALAFRRR